MATNGNSRYLATPQVAQRLGVNTGKVGVFIREGQLQAVDVSLRPGTGRPRWRISPEALAAFERARSNTPAEAVTHAG